jgi:hypothetical protein
VLGERTVLAKWREQCFRGDEEVVKVRMCTEMKNSEYGRLKE